jgi:hypothetical protein
MGASLCGIGVHGARVIVVPLWQAQQQWLTCAHSALSVVLSAAG